LKPVDAGCHNPGLFNPGSGFMSRSDWFRNIVLAISVALLGACASARPVMEWQDDAFSGAIDNLMVIAVVEDKALRRSVEDAYVDKFSELALTATPGYVLLPDIELLSRETVEAAIEDLDIDAVMVTRLVGVEEVEQYHPPSYYDYYDRYFLYTVPSSTQGYYTSFTLLKLETNLYDTASAKLVWSLQSESMESPAPEDLIEGQVALTVERLAARGLIAPAQ
jgi:hypothetical protein